MPSPSAEPPAPWTFPHHQHTATGAGRVPEPAGPCPFLPARQPGQDSRAWNFLRKRAPVSAVRGVFTAELLVHPSGQRARRGCSAGHPEPFCLLCSVGSRLSRTLPAPPRAPANLLEVQPAEHPETQQGDGWQSCSVLTGGGQLISAPRTSLQGVGDLSQQQGHPWHLPGYHLQTCCWAPSSTSALLITTDAFNNLDPENYHKVLLYPRFCTPFVLQDV